MAFSDLKDAFHCIYPRHGNAATIPRNLHFGFTDKLAKAFIGEFIISHVSVEFHVKRKVTYCVTRVNSIVTYCVLFSFRIFSESINMSNRIEILRKSRVPKMTQEALAIACGTTKQSMGRLASGKQPLTLEWMEIIAAALGCETYELIIDKEIILQREAAHLLKQRRIINAYEQLGADERKELDQKLFGNQGQENEARKKPKGSHSHIGGRSQSSKGAVK